MNASADAELRLGCIDLFVDDLVPGAFPEVEVVSLRMVLHRLDVLGARETCRQKDQKHQDAKKFTIIHARGPPRRFDTRATSCGFRRWLIGFR